METVTLVITENVRKGRVTFCKYCYPYNSNKGFEANCNGLLIITDLYSTK